MIHYVRIMSHVALAAAILVTPALLQAEVSPPSKEHSFKHSLKKDAIAVGQDFGVIVGSLTQDVRKELNVKLTDGVVVFAIIGNSLAEYAGLKSRVVITEINNKRVRNLEDFGRLLSQALSAGNFTVGTWEPTNPENQGLGQQVNFYFVPNRTD